MGRVLILVVVAFGVAGFACGRTIASTTPAQKFSEAMAALEVGDYETYVKDATGLLSVFPWFERRGELCLQIIKTMMFLGRYKETTAFAERVMAKYPYNVLNGEIKEEVKLIGAIEELPDELVQQYLEAEKMVFQHMIQAAIEQYWVVVDEPRAEGTALARRAKYEATRMDYLLLDRDYPKDPSVNAMDLVDLWVGYLAEAQDKEEEFLGLVNVLRVYSRYSEGRRKGEGVMVRPGFLTEALDLAKEYEDTFTDESRKLILRYRVALLHKKIGFYLILHDAGAAIREYQVAVKMIEEMIDAHPKWFLVTQGIRHIVEMRCAFGDFETLYKDLQEYIEEYPHDVEIGKALEYFSRFADNQRLFEYAFCTNQLILEYYPYTSLYGNAEQRYLPMLAAVNRDELKINLCRITYDPDVLGAAAEVSPETPEGQKEDHLAIARRERREREKKAKRKRYLSLGGLFLVLVIVFLITRRRA